MLEISRAKTSPHSDDRTTGMMDLMTSSGHITVKAAAMFSCTLLAQLAR